MAVNCPTICPTSVSNKAKLQKITKGIKNLNFLIIRLLKQVQTRVNRGKQGNNLTTDQKVPGLNPGGVT